jgi:hypothetical protein
MQKSQNQERLMNGKYTSFACFGLGVVFAVLLLFIGAQNGPFKRVFAASPVVMTTPGLQGHSPFACTSFDLQGRYGFYKIGATDVKQPGFPVANPLAAVGIIYFDGKGGGSSYFRQTREGVFRPPVPALISPDPTTQITANADVFSYSVSADCTFLLYSQSGTGASAVTTYSAQGVILGTGEEFYMMSMAPSGNAVVVVAKRAPVLQGPTSH